jgi:hypothetical protein
MHFNKLFHELTRPINRVLINHNDFLLNIDFSNTFKDFLDISSLVIDWNYR